MRLKRTATTRIMILILATLLTMTNNIAPAIGNIIAAAYDDVVILEDEDTIPLAMQNFETEKFMQQQIGYDVSSEEKTEETTQTRSIDDFINRNLENRLLVTKETERWTASIDYTDTTDGVVMVQCTSSEEKG